MASEVVVLSSSDEGENDEVQFCGVSQSEKAGNFRDVSPQRSDDSLDPNYFDSPVAPSAASAQIEMDPDSDSDSIIETGGNVDIDFSLAQFSQIKAASKSKTTASTYQLPEEIPSTSSGKKSAPAAKSVKSTKTASELKNPSKTKEDKAYEKALKAQDKAHEKALKAAEAANKKANKLSDCLQYVTASIDSQLLNSFPNSGNILTQLQEVGLKHAITLHSIPKSVYWKREKIEHFVDDGSQQLRSRSFVTEEEDAAVVVTAQEFISLAQVSIVDYVERVLTSLKKKSLNLIIYGINEYNREQSLKDKQRFRQRCTGEKPANRRGNVDINDDVGLTSSQLEDLKVQVLLQTQCSLWPVETTEELGKTIARFTKAIAERPFKEDRLEQNFDFYAAEASGGLKVTKDGQGLTRLWQQQIMQFPLVALETAQAIVSHYSTPQALLQAYKLCCDNKTASLLLQDIPVRRHAGPLSTSRRVGPELSKKIYKYLMSDNGEVIL